MTKQNYLDLKKKHEKELSDFPIAYAFNEQQLEDVLEKLGAKSTKECVTIFGHGDIVKKENAKDFIKMLSRHSDELREHMINDFEFATGAFRYEMDNHEYAINYDGDEEVLNCFGFKEEELVELGLAEAYSLARRQHMKNAQEWGVI